MLTKYSLNQSFLFNGSTVKNSNAILSRNLDTKIKESRIFSSSAKRSEYQVISRENNFDLIRLFAAFQVLFGHGIAHLAIRDKFLIANVFQFFPGVLMFFTVSGFLIFSSFDRNNNLTKYFYNRFLRLFPALWLCFIITVALLFFFRIISISDFFSGTILKWSLAQVSIFQFWTPDILRPWGVGTPNGSLWTIPVELQFYILLPIIVLSFKKIKLIYKFLFLVICSVLFNIYLSAFMGGGGERNRKYND